MEGTSNETDPLYVFLLNLNRGCKEEAEMTTPVCNHCGGKIWRLGHVCKKGGGSASHS